MNSMEAVIHTLQDVLKKKKVEAAVLTCVFAFVFILLSLPIAFTETSDFDVKEDFGIDIESVGNDYCQVINF